MNNKDSVKLRVSLEAYFGPHDWPSTLVNLFVCVVIDTKMLIEID
jgi:hypothetical protein